MNREIKFRAWDDGYMLQGHSFCINADNSVSYLNNKGEWTNKHNLILMQYTGLKDKNGKEIYEGDIIESFDSENKPIRHLIEYSSYDAKFIGTNTDGLDALIKLKSDLRQDWIIRYDKSIIGNIYENPELL